MVVIDGRGLLLAGMTTCWGWTTSRWMGSKWCWTEAVSRERLVSMTFALDWGRMALLSAPVFYPAGVYVLERRPGLQRPTIAAFAVLILIYAIYMAHSGVRTGILELARLRIQFADGLR